MKFLKAHLNSQGQAAVEYIIVLLFSVLIMVKIVNLFGDFFSDSLGNLGHVLSINLKVGVCKDRCFHSGYKNGYGQ
jgi:hypothetical protein